MDNCMTAPPHWDLIEISGPFYEIIEPGTVVDEDLMEEMIGHKLTNEHGDIIGEIYKVHPMTQTWYARVKASMYYLH